MFDIQAIKDDAAACRRNIPYSHLCKGSMIAAYILSDSKPQSNVYEDFSYCYVRQLQNNYGCIVLDLRCVDYVVFSPIGDVLGIIHEYQTPNDMVSYLKNSVDYYNKFITVDLDEMVFVSADNMRIIHTECVGTTVAKKCAIEYKLICTDVDAFLREVSTKLQYYRWMEFKQQTSADFDFEEED